MSTFPQKDAASIPDAVQGKITFWFSKESEPAKTSVKQKTPFHQKQGFQKKGDDILSHITAVPSAQAGLTT
ncbi:hypothetical protein, partial [Flavobacterium sp. LC2016-01]|uniref:hypothetical protein n=1 Tax=Flavobacterium sp. LC2016-01 TaxID=2675876 RepID=UPI001E333BAB